jgi:hypothetical protein
VRPAIEAISTQWPQAEHLPALHFILVTATAAAAAAAIAAERDTAELVARRLSEASGSPLSGSSIISISVTGQRLQVRQHAHTAYNSLPSSSSVQFKTYLHAIFDVLVLCVAIMVSTLLPAQTTNLHRQFA